MKKTTFALALLALIGAASSAAAEERIQLLQHCFGPTAHHDSSAKYVYLRAAYGAALRNCMAAEP